MTAARRWTGAEDARLRTLVSDRLSIPQMARELDRNRSVVRAALVRLDLLKEVQLRNLRWSEEDIATLQRLYADTPTREIAAQVGRSVLHVYSKATKLGLEKSEAYMGSPHACRLRRGDNVGAAHRFPKGHVPANKGARRPGWAPGRMADTQFKKGQRGNKFVPVGSLRVNADGYLDRKINDTGKSNIDWRSVHRLVWEAEHGAVPPKHAVVFRAGRKTIDVDQITLDALELLTQAELMRRNTVHARFPPEVVQVIQLRGAVVRAINRRSKQHEEQN